MKSVAIIVEALLIPLNGAWAAMFTGRVVGVHDGETITVLDDSKAQHKIRLTGIDAPELMQAFGPLRAVASTRLVACRPPHGSESFRGRMMDIGAVLNRLNHFDTRSNRTLKRFVVAVFGDRETLCDLLAVRQLYPCLPQAGWHTRLNQEYHTWCPAAVVGAAKLMKLSIR